MHGRGRMNGHVILQRQHGGRGVTIGASCFSNPTLSVRVPTLFFRCLNLHARCLGQITRKLCICVYRILFFLQCSDTVMVELSRFSAPRYCCTKCTAMRSIATVREANDVCFGATRASDLISALKKGVSPTLHKVALATTNISLRYTS